VDARSSEQIAEKTPEQDSESPRLETGMPPNPTPEPRTSETSPVLKNLIAADLVNHEMIGDPARLGGEAVCLRALCALVGGSVYRIDPYHYAFCADRNDLGGRLAELAPDDWAQAFEAALQVRLGADAVWVNATPAQPDAADSDDTAGKDKLDSGAVADAAPLVYLQAYSKAVAGVTPPDPGLQAVINARYAAETARLTAGAAPGEALDGRLAGLENQLQIISEKLVAVLGQLESLETRVESSGTAPDVEAFQDTVGLALAEFLARLERHTETAAPVNPTPARAAGA